MIAVVERDRRLGRRLAWALAERGCETRVVHGYRDGAALLRGAIPEALYVSEALQRASGGDLLAVVDRDERLADLPTMVRVSRSDSLFARAMRRGGLRTVVAPLDVEAVATILLAMASQPPSARTHVILREAQLLRERATHNRDRAAREIERTHREIERTRGLTEEAKATGQRARTTLASRRPR
jgi:DNA-binding response OmpR family regulator